MGKLSIFLRKRCKKKPFSFSLGAFETGCDDQDCCCSSSGRPLMQDHVFPLCWSRWESSPPVAAAPRPMHSLRALRKVESPTSWLSPPILCCQNEPLFFFSCNKHLLITCYDLGTLKRPSYVRQLFYLQTSYSQITQYKNAFKESQLEASACYKKTTQTNKCANKEQGETTSCGL